VGCDYRRDLAAVRVTYRVYTDGRLIDKNSV
jgi:hypothetical protein